MKRAVQLFTIVLVCSLSVSFFSTTTTAQTIIPLSVYSDALASGWGDWSWNITDNLSNSSPVHAGTHSVAVTFTQGWDGLQFGQNNAQSLVGYDTLRFWIHGGVSGGQTVDVQVHNASAYVDRTITATANGWTMIDVPITGLVPLEATTLVWFNSTSNGQATFYLDDIAFVNTGIPTPTPSAGPALSVNVAADRHAVSPYIYGINFADPTLAAELHLPVDRYGGNATTRYNWQNDTANHASDWYFENIPNANANPSQLPNGSASDQFVDQDRSTGAKTVMTVPLIGWTPKSRAVTCGFSVSKYGAQQSVDPWQTDCGNGVTTGGTNITGNNPLDTSVAITQTFVQNWIQYLIGNYGTAANGGVMFYNLDNEPMLWNSTHRDVHPTPTSYDEIRDRTYQYAAAIKATDSNAQTLGPVLWGWVAYFYSALDVAAGGSWWDTRPDRRAHGDIPFLDWYLQQMRAYEQINHTRILDYLDIHYYPQANGVSLSPAGDANTQALRLRSTRSLWDPTYVDESWIAATGEGPYVRLIPRMRDWVNNNYPGTKIAITEYNWGALDHINGALAQADVLDIFGRESLDLATLWGPPTSSQPGAFAFRMYRNYDGTGEMFGDVSVRATSADQGQLAIYAAQRSSDSALTLVIINKNTGALTSTVTLSGFTPSSNAQVYSYSTNNLNAIVRQSDQVVTANGYTSTFPASSITLMVVPAQSNFLPKLFLPLLQR